MNLTGILVLGTPGKKWGAEPPHWPGLAFYTLIC